MLEQNSHMVLMINKKRIIAICLCLKLIDYLTIRSPILLQKVFGQLNIKLGTQLFQLKIVKWSPFELNVQLRVTI